jgi:Methyltransferase domain
MRAEAERALARLADRELGAAQREYLYLHGERYAVLLDGLRAVLSGGGSGDGRRALDIGPSFQTALIREVFPDLRVDTAGFRSGLAEPRKGERHVDFDLNLAGDVDRRPQLGPYDAIILAEVIEHLIVSPRELFECIGGWLAPTGVLIVQTPNLLALHKRARMLVGRNPLGEAASVAAAAHNPGHFREYTLGELAEVASAAGLAVDSASIRNYFRHRSPGRRAYDRISAVLPAGTRQGITLYLRAAATPGAGASPRGGA